MCEWVNGAITGWNRFIVKFACGPTRHRSDVLIERLDDIIKEIRETRGKNEYPQ